MKRTVLVVFGLAVLTLAAGSQLPAMAHLPQQTYTVDWWTVDGGGATFSTGAGYSLGGTAGQPDAGVLAGGGYTLGGGFWKGGPLAALWYSIYLPLVLRSYTP